MNKQTLFRSQDHVRQDQFVDDVLRQKRGGTFLDVGCYDCERINNTWFFEHHRGWRGVGIDIDPIHEMGWLARRKASKFICSDATKIDYSRLCDDTGLPVLIDYLSLDLEPPSLTLVALERILESDRRFSVITYETDYYRCKDTQAASRELMLDAGYVLYREGTQDDFYVSVEIAESLDKQL